MKVEKHKQITNFMSRLVREFKQYNNYTVTVTNEFKTKKK